MSKRKNSNKVINNIENLNLDIDYEKLADAIIKAQNKVSSGKNNNSRFRSGLMQIFNGCMYILGVFLSGTCIYKIWTNYSLNQVTLINAIVFTILFVFIGVYFFLCQQETLKDKDSDSREHFTINISLIALIVSLIALFREVA